MTRAVRILVTGFKPFAGHAANPSQRVAEALAAEAWTAPLEVRAALLEVSFAQVEAQFNVAMRQCRPHAVIGFGLDYGSDAVKLERIAVNLDEAAIPDETGERRAGTRISSRGPAARWATLPLDPLHAAVSAAGVPVKFSAHAGTFLCNHLLYHALGFGDARSGKARLPIGFVHLPPTPDLIKPEDRPRRAGTEFAELLRAARAIVSAVGGTLVRPRD